MIKFWNRYAALSEGGLGFGPVRAPQSAFEELGQYLESLPYAFYLNLDGEITELSEQENLDLVHGTTNGLPNVLVDYCGYPMYYYLSVPVDPSRPVGNMSPDPSRFADFARDLTGGICAVSSLPDRGSMLDVFLPLPGSGYPYPRGLSVNEDLEVSHNAYPSGPSTGFVVNTNTPHGYEFYQSYPQYNYSSFAIVVNNVPRYFYCYGANRFGWPAGPGPYSYALFVKSVMNEFQSAGRSSGGTGTGSGPSPGPGTPSTGGSYPGVQTQGVRPGTLAGVLALGGALILGGYYLLKK